MDWYPLNDFGYPCDDRSTDEVTDEDEIRGLVQGKLYPYLEAPDVYHCPGDNLRRAAPDGSKMFVSYSMAKCLYGFPTSTDSRIQVKRLTEIRSPSTRYNFVECGEMNLNWGGGGDFRIANPQESPSFGDYAWWTPIAINHGDSSTFGFCDGHAERKKWTSGTALAQYEKGFLQGPGQPYGVVQEEPKSDDLRYLIRGWPNR